MNMIVEYQVSILPTCRRSSHGISLAWLIPMVRLAQHTAPGPHAAREAFSWGPRELSQLQKMSQKPDFG